LSNVFLIFQTVRLTIIEINTQYADNVTLYDGVDDTAPVIVNLNGSPNYSPVTYSSSQRYMYVTFTSASSIDQETYDVLVTYGFTATYFVPSTPRESLLNMLKL